MRKKIAHVINALLDWYAKHVVAICIISVVICIAIAYWGNYQGIRNYKLGLFVVLGAHLCILLLAIIQLLLVGAKYVWEIMKPHLLVPLIGIGTFALPCVVHYLFFIGDTIEETVLFSFYGDYLTFIGALALGYAMYRTEQNRRKELQKKTARMLYESLSQSIQYMDNVESLSRQGTLIPITAMWRDYYFDICSLIKHDEMFFRTELTYIYKVIGDINAAIQASKSAEAVNIYKTFIKEEQYSGSAYNHIEVQSTLYCIAYLDFLPQNKIWKEEEKDTIERYAKKFYDVIEQWIYNYLRYKRKTSLLSRDEIIYELVDWLLMNPELKAWVKHPYDKRKISEAVFHASLEMEKTSNRVGYCWGEYTLK